jgi:SsrA-binding protein
MAKKPETQSRIADNKKAAFNYFFEERFEAGIVLHGWEVKALRSGKVQLTDGYVIIKDGELFLLGCQINPLKTASTPVNLHWKNGYVKCDIALAKGKAEHDKRDVIKDREGKREVERAMKSFNR